MIPKILHLQWVFDKWPSFGDAVVGKYAEMLPDWEIRVAREIPVGFPSDLARYLENERIPSACRADLVRYWSLYSDGGVYADLDTIPLKYFDDALLNRKVFTARCNGEPGRSTVGGYGWIDCCFLGSEPGNIYWEKVFGKCRNHRSWRQQTAWFAAVNTFPMVGIDILDDACQEVKTKEREAFLDFPEMADASGTGYIKHYRLTGLLCERDPDYENHWDAPTWEDLYGDK